MSATVADSTVLRGPGLAELPIVNFFDSPGQSHGFADSELVTALDIAQAVQPAPTSEPTPEPAAAPAGPTDAELEAAYQRGRRDGNAASSTIEAAISAREAVAGAVTELRTAIEAQRSATDELAVELAIEISRLILAREIATATDPGRDALGRCLAETDASALATVRLNPVDLAALGEIDDLTVGRSVELVADPSVDSGDAIAEVSGGRVDASLAEALQRVAKALRS